MSKNTFARNQSNFFRSNKFSLVGACGTFLALMFVLQARAADILNGTGFIDFVMPSNPCKLQRRLKKSKKGPWRTFSGKVAPGTPAQAQITLANGDQIQFQIFDIAYKDYNFQGSKACLFAPTPPYKEPTTHSPVPAPPNSATVETPPILPPVVDQHDTEMRDPSKHKGYVAFFGPLYYIEKLNFSVINTTNVEKIKANSFGFLAGGSAEYKIRFFSFNLDAGLFGARYSGSNDGPKQFIDYNASGLSLGVLARIYTLFRIGPVEVGPSFSEVLRYTAFRAEATGTVLTKKLQPYPAAGLRILYRFGEFRLGSDVSYLNFKAPLVSLEAQFEL